MRRALLIGLVVTGVSGAVFYATGDDEPAGPPHYSIFDRPAGPEDRAPQGPGSPSLRTEEQTGELRLAGTFRGHRFYLGRTRPGMCSFIQSPDGSTGSGCSQRPRPFVAFSSGEPGGGMISFVALPDGYTEAEVYTGRIVDDKLMENGYAAVARGPASVRFSGPYGERTVELSY